MHVALPHGTVPPTVTLARRPAVYVQDLAVVIPVLFIGAAWLWRQRNWGIVLTDWLLVLSVVMLVALFHMSLFTAQARITVTLDMFPVYRDLMLVSLAVSGLYFTRLSRSSAVNRSQRVAPIALLFHPQCLLAATGP
jgi:hypothetical protein